MISDDCDMVLAFYTPGVGLLDADWLQRVSCRALIGWSLQRVTSLRHAVAAKVLLLGSAFCGLLHSPSPWPCRPRQWSSQLGVKTQAKGRTYKS